MDMTKLSLLCCVLALAPKHAVDSFCVPMKICKDQRIRTGIFLSSEGSNDVRNEDTPPGRQMLSDTQEKFRRIQWDDVRKGLFEDLSDVSNTVATVSSSFFQSDSSKIARSILQISDDLDALEEERRVHWSLSVREIAMKLARYELLSKLMRQDYLSYVSTASFLSPSRMSRLELPNVQDVPYQDENDKVTTSEVLYSDIDERGVSLVPDCSLPTVVYDESILDKLLLSIFRNLVTKHTGGVRSNLPGILGLLEQGRVFMLQPNQTPEAQHQMVSNTLGGLMTPVLPPFYRIFMSGVVPEVGTQWDGRQLGPWFYAPLLTSIVTPTFFGFLVGPSRPNRRKDGRYGGLVVEKCKFLQESGCKGLCLHQCKLPAQQFFADTLALPLTVTPNFITQECQWSFGETPIPVAADPSFPKGCLSGCASRKAVNEMKQNGTVAYLDLCN